MGITRLMPRKYKANRRSATSKRVRGAARKGPKKVVLGGKRSKEDNDFLKQLTAGAGDKIKNAFKKRGSGNGFSDVSGNTDKLTDAVKYTAKAIAKEYNIPTLRRSIDIATNTQQMVEAINKAELTEEQKIEFINQII